jgi:hypothetical protein
MSNRAHRVLPRRRRTIADGSAKQLLRLVAAGSVAATATFSLAGPSALATASGPHQAVLASAVSATSQPGAVYGAPGLVGATLNAPIVAMSSTPSGQGAWLLGSDGGIFTLGDARFFGSTGGMRLNQPVVGMASTPDGGGYWTVAADGGIFAFGDASFDGSLAGRQLNSPVVGMARMPTGSGYWLVARDGGIFTFGSAPFEGSAWGLHGHSPIVGMAATPDGHGYWIVARNGGVFSYGDASFYGSPAGQTLTSPVVGMAASPDGGGYWLTEQDGQVLGFGDAHDQAASAGTFSGSAAAIVSSSDDSYAVASTDGSVASFGQSPSTGAAISGVSSSASGSVAPVSPSTGGSSLSSPTSSSPVSGAPAPPAVGGSGGGSGSGSGSGGGGTTGGSTVTAAMIGADMTDPNTVFPAGVPSSWSWYAGPEVKAGNTPPAGYDSMTAWGTVYPASTGTSDKNTRVELRNEETWIYSKSQSKWEEIQSSVAPNGSLYYEDLSGNATFPANLRIESDGGLSVKMVPGYTFQFFPQGSRPTIDPSDIGGVVTTVDARLVVDNPALPDDTADAHYIVDSGGDYWMTPTAPYPDNAEIFTSRYNTISTSWTTICASTLSASQLNGKLPPVA